MIMLGPDKRRHTFFTQFLINDRFRILNKKGVVLHGHCLKIFTKISNENLSDFEKAYRDDERKFGEEI